MDEEGTRPAEHSPAYTQVGRRWGALGLAAMFIFLSAAACGTGEVAAAPVSCSFTGPASGDWHTAVNWSCGQVPDADDDVFVDGVDSIDVAAAAVAGTLNITGGGSIDFAAGASLTVGSTFAANSGMLRGPGAIVVGGAFTNPSGTLLVLNGAQLVLNAASSIAGGDISIQNGADVEINSTFTILPGSAFAPFSASCDSTDCVHITATGHLIKAGAGDKFSNTSIDNDGTLTVEAGTFFLVGGTKGATSDGAYIVNSGAVLDMRDGHYAIGTSGRVGGEGTVEARGLNLALAAGARLDPAVLNVVGVLVLDGTTPLTLPRVNLIAGTIDSRRPLTVTNLNATGGSLQGDFVLTVPAGGSFTKTTGGNLFIQNGFDRRSAELVLNVDATLEGGAIGVGNSDSSIPDLPHLWINRRFTIADGASNTPFSGGGNIHITAPNGHLVKTGTGSKISFSIVDVDGTLTVESGTFNLMGGSAHGNGAVSDGSYLIDAGAVLRFEGGSPPVIGGRIGGAGTLQVANLDLTFANGSTLDPAVMDLIGAIFLDGSGPSVSLLVLNQLGGSLDTDRPVSVTTLNTTGGAIQGTANVTVPAGGGFSKTTTGQLLMDGNADLVLNADASFEGGTICLDSRSDPDLIINATLTIGAGTPLSSIGCSGIGAPTVHINGPNGRLVSARTDTEIGNAENSGTVTVAAGQTINFSNGYSQNGGLTDIAAGGALILPQGATLTGGVLRGGGQVRGNITNTGGTVIPGSSPGTLTITGAYTQAAGGTLQIDVAGTTRGSGYDHLAVGGAAVLDGTVAIIQGAGFDPALNDAFQFLTSASRTGKFAALTGSTLPSGKSYVIDHPGAPDFGARLLVEQPPALSINDVTSPEGNSGNTPFLFTVSLSSPAPASGVSVQFRTRDGTALSSALDYTAADGTLTFAQGEDRKGITVNVNGDTTPESDEDFRVELFNPVGATLGDAQGIGTILNDDVAPITISINDVSAPEGNSGDTSFTFTVSLSAAAPAGGVSVSFQTASGSATLIDGDYRERLGSLSFVEGEQQKPLAILVRGDTKFEPDEDFRVSLFNPVGATLGDAQGIGTILNDDVAPITISINDVSAPEGNSGDTSFTFTVSLSAAAPAGGVSVSFQTASGSATLIDGDYRERLGSLSFVEGEQQKPLAILVRGDTKFEPDEDFRVSLFNPVGATLGDAQGIGTILNDDAPPPEMSIADASVLEGNSGTKNLVFRVTLSSPAPPGGVSAGYRLSDDTARVSDDDYNLVPPNAMVIFPEGTLERTITILVRGDTKFEPDERFQVSLFLPNGVTFGDSLAFGTILNDDAPPPEMSIADASVLEGNSGTKNLVFRVTLSSPAPPGGVSAGYRLSDDTARVSDDDYNLVPPNAMVIFPEGTLERTITILVRGDTKFEPDERFQVSLFLPNGVTFGDSLAFGTILNDDAPPPEMSIADASVLEGNSGTKNLVFRVTLSSPAPPGGVSAGYRLSDDTARVSDDDYNLVPPNAMVTFPEGTLERTITILVRGDTKFEPDERFQVSLFLPNGVTFRDSLAFGTILNDDDPPLTVSINDVTMLECTAGTGSRFVFTVSLSRPAPIGGVSVDFATSGLEFVLHPPNPGVIVIDYDPQSGRLNFASREQTKEIVVKVLCDGIPEQDEVFFVNLRNSRGATIEDGEGRGTILNPPPEPAPDPGPTISIDNVTIKEGDNGTRPLVFTVSLSRAAPAWGVFVDYATDDGGADAPADYTATSGRLMFLPGQRQRQITVPVVGDLLAEANEVFYVQLTNALGGTIGSAGRGTGTIENDDQADVGISDVTHLERGCTPNFLPGLPPNCAPGTPSIFVFAVTLSGPASSDGLSVNYSTANGSASAGSDFAGASGTVTFNRGERFKDISVTVNDDQTPEQNENFFVNLNNPVGLNIVDGSATGTIIDNDRTISIGDVSRPEGDSGNSAFVFEVSLSAPAGAPVTVDFDASVAGGTANARDYTPRQASGALRWETGQQVQRITVDVHGDADIEADETFFIELSNASANARIADSHGQGTIENDDQASSHLPRDLGLAFGLATGSAALLFMSVRWVLRRGA